MLYFLHFYDLILHTVHHTYSTSLRICVCDKILLGVHNTKNKLIEDQIIIKLLKEKPDAIFITGDIVDANTPDINVAANFINQIADIAPIVKR